MEKEAEFAFRRVDVFNTVSCLDRGRNPTLAKSDHAELLKLKASAQHVGFRDVIAPEDLVSETSWPSTSIQDG